MTEQFFVDEAGLNCDDFARLCSRTTSISDYPQATDVQCNVLIYDGRALRASASDTAASQAMKSELHRCLKDGPGVLVVRSAWPNASVVDQATAVFQQIIQQEAAEAEHRGDHFAAPGENERIWNALQKFCQQDSELFVDYYSNPVLGLVCEAWLGPGYQVTSQVNIVKPGGQAQKAHRDYHLGFQENAVVRQYPVSVQVASQFLTLQGAVAHTEMTPQSGPTRLLPWSQLYPAGYLAWRQPEFIDYFEQHSIQLPLSKGDAVFFSPAMFHAAGSNSEDTDRIANLLQISAAFGKTMESVDWPLIARLVYPVLQQRQIAGQLNPESLRWLGGSIADGYSFPTNLDSDPPVSGCAPETSQQLIARALEQDWTPQDFEAALDAASQRRQP